MPPVCHNGQFPSVTSVPSHKYPIYAWLKPSIAICFKRPMLFATNAPLWSVTSVPLPSSTAVHFRLLQAPHRRLPQRFISVCHKCPIAVCHSGSFPFATNVLLPSSTAVHFRLLQASHCRLPQRFISVCYKRPIAVVFHSGSFPFATSVPLPSATAVHFRLPQMSHCRLPQRFISDATSVPLPSSSTAVHFRLLQAPHRRLPQRFISVRYKCPTVVGHKRSIAVCRKFFIPVCYKHPITVCHKRPNAVCPRRPFAVCQKRQKHCRLSQASDCRHKLSTTVYHRRPIPFCHKRPITVCRKRPVTVCHKSYRLSQAFLCHLAQASDCHIKQVFHCRLPNITMAVCLNHSISVCHKRSIVFCHQHYIALHLKHPKCRLLTQDIKRCVLGTTDIDDMSLSDTVDLIDSKETAARAITETSTFIAASSYKKTQRAPPSANYESHSDDPRLRQRFKCDCPVVTARFKRIRGRIREFKSCKECWQRDRLESRNNEARPPPQTEQALFQCISGISIMTSPDHPSLRVSSVSRRGRTAILRPEQYVFDGPGIGWRKGEAQQHPTIHLRVSTDDYAYATFNLSPPRPASAYLEAVADTGLHDGTKGPALDGLGKTGSVASW